MWFSVLGPLLVREGNTVAAVPAARQRVLLAALLVRAGQVVAADTLAETVWDGAPPAGAAATLRSHVMRLRRVLGPRAGARVATRYPGYLVQAGEQEVDLLTFGRLCDGGGAAAQAGDWARACEVLGEALALWRGAPLADIPSESLHRDEVPRLEQMRLQAVEWRIDAGLRLGWHGALVAELQSLVTQFPLRERFHSQLMLALYRCGRQGDALAAYQEARRLLIAELGAEPGAELRELHQCIIAADPGLELAAPVTAATPAASGPGQAVPRELPGSVSHFTGREAELAALTRLADTAGRQAPGTVLISAIGGTAGVGKTALAVHWAHQVSERFPDGQIYVNLRGYDPGRPLSQADALAGFLRALGVPSAEIPADTDERAARYRSLLAGRRILVVLDNAASVEQVRPLLPAEPACMAIVTSRDTLAGLVARNGAERLDLDVLPMTDAVGLLRSLIGGRVDDDPVAAATLARQCARLPLVLRVAAEMAVARPSVSLAGLACELADQQGRLDLFDASGDPRTAVRAVFSWSYRHLDPGANRAFRLLGLHPGPDLDRYATAALTGTSLEQAGYLLDLLARAYLIQPARRGRFVMHDLLRASAREFAAAVHTEEERRAALTRLFGYYLHTAAAAMDALMPAERHRRPRVPAATVPVPSLSGPAQAREWLDAERATLAATAAHAATNGWASHTTTLATTLQRYLSYGGHYSDAITIQEHACHAAHKSGDRVAEATALDNLGTIEEGLGHYDRAATRLRRALALFRELGDRKGEARALGNLANAEAHLGCYQQAVDHQRQALALFARAGDRVGRALALGGLGDVEHRLGRHQAAAGHLREALALFRDTGHRAGEGLALTALGIVAEKAGGYDEAATRIREALVLFRDTGHRAGEGLALTTLGIVAEKIGRYHEAARHHEQALDLFREVGYLSGESEALNGTAETMLAVGEYARARASNEAALSVAAKIGNGYEQARAHDGMACAYLAEGDPALARFHWREALDRYVRMGTPESRAVRDHLAALDDDPQPACCDG
jgi:DNA-binding SARP family transcriptional activator/tetratricopeptide (TPR) repeat protein